ncbi:hypothetical protein ACFQV4_29075 [Streptomyces thermocarboxydus]
MSVQKPASSANATQAAASPDTAQSTTAPAGLDTPAAQDERTAATSEASSAPGTPAEAATTAAGTGGSQARSRPSRRRTRSARPSRRPPCRMVPARTASGVDSGRPRNRSSPWPGLSERP